MTNRAKKQHRKRWVRTKELGISLTLFMLVGLLYATTTSLPGFPRYQRLLKLERINRLLDVLETKTLDMRFQWRGEIEPRDDIVIVAVDEKADDTAENITPSGPDKVLSDDDVDQFTKPQDKKDEKTEEADADAGEKQDEESDPDTENAAKAKSAKNSILSVFKRKKKEPEKPQEENTDASAQSGNEIPPEEKA